MAEHTTLKPRDAHWRLVLALIAVVLLPSLCAAWFNGWSFFSFPFGTFLIWLGVPLGLIALAMMIPSDGDDEASDL